jgi:hypothetical protein
MTPLQASILHLIVQTAKREAWCVPTGQKLAELLSEKLEKNISARTASDHLQRLQLTQDCFRKRGRGRVRYINTETLCTEPESALYLLMLDDLSRENENLEGRVSKESLHSVLREQFHLMPQAMEEVFMHGCKTGYIEEIYTDLGYIRVGHRTREQRRYLEMLVPEQMWSAYSRSLSLDNRTQINRPSSVFGSLAV